MSITARSTARFMVMVSIVECSSDFPRFYRPPLWHLRGHLSQSRTSRNLSDYGSASHVRMATPVNDLRASHVEDCHGKFKDSKEVKQLFDILSREAPEIASEFIGDGRATLSEPSMTFLDISETNSEGMRNPIGQIKPIAATSFNNSFCSETSTELSLHYHVNEKTIVKLDISRYLPSIRESSFVDNCFRHNFNIQRDFRSNIRDHTNDADEVSIFHLPKFLRVDLGLRDYPNDCAQQYRS
jgi:hypothetical protein